MKIEPLTESYYYILLCLYKEPSHGYGIMQMTLNLSNGRVKIGSGTMYGAVSNMMKKAWIREAKIEILEGDRKRMYELTNLGGDVLKAEVDRQKELLRSAEQIMGGGILL